jgi:hypothetical protein
MGIATTEYRLSLDQSGAGLGASWVLPSGTTARFTIAPTLTAEDLAEHRWYLEEYFVFPGPGDHARARAFEQRLEAFGQALHQALFLKGRDLLGDLARAGTSAHFSTATIVRLTMARSAGVRSYKVKTSSSIRSSRA